MGSILFILLSFSSLEAKVHYLKNMYAHIHSLPSVYSSSRTIISCGHPVEVLEISREKRKLVDKWSHVRASGQKGYILKSLLSIKRPDCFQDKYPRFFSEIDLSMDEIHHWGRLYDLYIYGKSKVGK